MDSNLENTGNATPADSSRQNDDAQEITFRTEANNAMALHERFMTDKKLQENMDVPGLISFVQEDLAQEPKDRRLRERLNYLKHASFHRGMSLSYPADQVSTLSAICHISLQGDDGNDQWTRAIGEAFILRGKEYERRGHFIEAMRDYMCALEFNYNSELKWEDRYTENEPEYENQVQGELESTHFALRSFFGFDEPTQWITEACKMLPGYFVVIQGVVVGQFPLDEYGGEEAVSFANQIVSDKRTRWNAIADYGAIDFDESEIPKVFEYLGQGQPQLIHSPEDVQDAVTAQ